MRVNSIKIFIAEKMVNYLIRLLDHIMTNPRCVLIIVSYPSLTESELHLVIPYALFVLVSICTAESVLLGNCYLLCSKLA